jgi:hypothetical protein
MASLSSRKSCATLRSEIERREPRRTEQGHRFFLARFRTQRRSVPTTLRASDRQRKAMRSRMEPTLYRRGFFCAAPRPGRNRAATRGAFLLINLQLQAYAFTHGDSVMKNGSKRRAWTSVQVRELKSLARKKTPAKKIAKSLKRTEGATRQKAFSIGLSLDSR